MYVYKVQLKRQHYKKQRSEPQPCTMKTLFAITLLSLFAMMHTAIVDNGRPSCDSEGQMEITFFRNTFDPTAYWVCVDLNEPAALQRCPDQTAFLDSIKSCVHWDDWYWEEKSVYKR